MDILSFLPTYLTAIPVNLVLIALVILYVFVILKDNFEEPNVEVRSPRRDVGVICGPEIACKRLAGSVLRAERFEFFRKPEQVLDDAIRGDMVLMFIVKEKLSGIADSIFKHLQRAYDLRSYGYTELRYVVFGIGDTTDENFNALAIEFDLRLRKVGAKNVKPMRLFDVATSNDGLEKEFFDYATGIAPYGLEKLNGAVEECDMDVSEGSEFEDGEQFERSQEIEIVDSDVETEEPAVESEKPVVEAAKTEAVEPVVDNSKAVAKPEKPDTEAAAKMGTVEEEADQSDRVNNSKQEKSETEDDEDWEIIKVMSTSDESS